MCCVFFDYDKSELGILRNGNIMATKNGSFLHFLENSKDRRIDVFQKTIWLLKELVKWTNKQSG